MPTRALVRPNGKRSEWTGESCFFEVAKRASAVAALTGPRRHLAPVGELNCTARRHVESDHLVRAW